MADDEASSAVTLDMNSLETDGARLLIPFLRTASLVKHYVYKQDLPDIDEDDEEFDQLIKFLDLVKRPQTKLEETEEVPMDESSTHLSNFNPDQLNRYREIVYLSQVFLDFLHISKIGTLIFSNPLECC